MCTFCIIVNFQFKEDKTMQKKQNNKSQIYYLVLLKLLMRLMIIYCVLIVVKILRNIETWIISFNAKRKHTFVWSFYA